MLSYSSSRVSTSLSRSLLCSAASSRLHSASVTRSFATRSLTSSSLTRPVSSIRHFLSSCLSRSFPSFSLSSRRSFGSTASLAPLSRVRNVAIIAHVDHGKTTLVDCLLRQSRTRLNAAAMGEARIMDSNELEKERGITILSKCTSVVWEPTEGGDSYHVNIVDTPGHADFGGEVERIMTMVDGVCLVVDATDGPMTQTKFVLQKALKRGLKPVVVINKVDRPTARLGEVENEIFDLFANLNATDDQMDFPIVYACARDGWATFDPKVPEKTMKPLFETILRHVPAPNVTLDAPFSMLITQIDSDVFLGKLLLGRIWSGQVNTGDKVKALDESGKLLEEVKVMKILCRRGTEQVVVDSAQAGDIISIAGFQKASVNSTLCNQAVDKPIPSIPIDPPTLSMSFFVNDSPLAGQDGGTSLTSAMIRDRLLKEAESNVSIAVYESENKEAFEVRGRGELQLGVLIETMRREGFELSVSAPRVVFKENDKGGNNELLEPLEEVTIDTPQEFTGNIIEQMTHRRGELQEFTQTDDGKARLVFRIPMRGLIGYRTQLTNDTRGTAILNNIFHSWVSHVGDIEKSQKGAIISQSDGVTTAFALESIESRGVMFIEPGVKVYSGMVIGEHSREENLEVNPCKMKALTNMRTVMKEDKTKLTPPRVMSLEEMIACVRDDEIIEVTGKNIRLRKKILDSAERMRQERMKKNRIEKAKESKGQ